MKEGFSLTTVADGVLLIRHPSVEDRRGTTDTPFDADTFEELSLRAGLESTDLHFVRELVSWSKSNVVRGMHFGPDRFSAGYKLIRCSRGSILDVLVDMRTARDSGAPKTLSFELNESSRTSLLVAPYYAHGYAVRGDFAEVHYLLTKTDAREGAFRWDSFGYRWPLANPVLSDRDAAAKPFHDVENHWSKSP